MTLQCPSRSRPRKLQTVIGKSVRYRGNRRCLVFGLTGTSPVPPQLGQGASSAFFPRPPQCSQLVYPIGGELIHTSLLKRYHPPETLAKIFASCSSSTPRVLPSGEVVAFRL